MSCVYCWWLYKGRWFRCCCCARILEDEPLAKCPDNKIRCITCFKNQAEPLPVNEFDAKIYGGGKKKLTKFDKVQQKALKKKFKQEQYDLDTIANSNN